MKSQLRQWIIGGCVSLAISGQAFAGFGGFSMPSISPPKVSPPKISPPKIAPPKLSTTPRTPNWPTSGSFKTSTAGGSFQGTSPKNFGISGFSNGGSKSPSFNGNIANNKNGFLAGGNYSAPGGMRAGGNLATTGINNFNVNGMYAGGKNSTSYGGAMSNGKNGFAASGSVLNPNGNSYGGNLAYRNKENFNIGGNYNQYGGYAKNNNGLWNVGGNGSVPTAIPGTKINFAGDAALRGRDTTLSGNGSFSDYTGKVKVFRGEGVMDRKNINTNSTLGWGNVTSKERGNVNFSGFNTRVTNNQNVNLGGLAGNKGSFDVSRSGASYKANQTIGGKQVGSLTAKADSKSIQIGNFKTNTKPSIGGKSLPW